MLSVRLSLSRLRADRMRLGVDRKTGVKEWTLAYEVEIDVV